MKTVAGGSRTLHKLAKSGRKDSKPRMGNCCKRNRKNKVVPVDEFEEVKSQLHAPIIWIIGSAGSGVEGQVRRMKHRYKLHNLSPSYVLKAEMESRSPRGIQLAHLVLKDALPPENVVMDLFRHQIYEYMHVTNGFYMEHFPLTVEQGTLFEELVAPVAIIFYFQCPEKVIKRRLSRGASITAKEDAQIHERVLKFHSRSSPVLEYYGSRVIRIDSVGPPDEVFLRVIEVMEKLYKNNLYSPSLPFNYTRYSGDD